jgi:hypothetical protein
VNLRGITVPAILLYGPMALPDAFGGLEHKQHQLNFGVINIVAVFVLPIFPLVIIPDT